MNKPEQEKQAHVRQSMLYFIPVVGGRVLHLMALPLLTRALVPEEYGILALAQAYAVFLIGLGSMGLLTTYERNFHQYRDDRVGSGQLLYTLLLFVLGVLGLLLLITWLFREPVSDFLLQDPSHGGVLVLIFVAESIGCLISFLQTYFKSSERAGLFIRIAIIREVLSPVLTVLFTVVLHGGMMGYALAAVLAIVGTMVPALSKTLRLLPIGFNLPMLKESLRIGLPLTPRIFFGGLNTQFDKYMLSILSSMGGVGVFSLGQRVSALVPTFMNTLGNVFQPRLYKMMFAEEDNGGRAIGLYVTPFMYLSIFAGLFVALFAEEVVFLLTPKTYAMATDVVTVLALYYGTIFFGKTTGIQLIYMKKTHITSMLTILSIVLNVALNIPFIFWWGAVGAAWATCLAGVMSGAVSFVVAQRYYQIRYENAKAFAIYGAFFLFTVVVLLLRVALDWPYLPRLGIKLLFVGGYLYLGVLIGLVNRDNLALLMRTARGLLPNRA